LSWHDLSGVDHGTYEKAIQSREYQGMTLGYSMCAWVLSPLALLAFAWSRSDKPIELSVLALSALLFFSAAIRDLKLVLLGSDYSHRLFTTIEVNVLVAIVLGLYLGIKRRWIASIAAVILALGWFLAGVANSVV
jgi:hypothetical protein